jgi:hypothetical protein
MKKQTKARTAATLGKNGVRTTKIPAQNRD